MVGPVTEQVVEGKTHVEATGWYGKEIWLVLG
jgi:hypothetical protein